MFGGASNAIVHDHWSGNSRLFVWPLLPLPVPLPGVASQVQNPLVKTIHGTYSSEITPRHDVHPGMTPHLHNLIRSRNVYYDRTSFFLCATKSCGILNSAVSGPIILNIITLPQSQSAVVGLICGSVIDSEICVVSPFRRFLFLGRRSLTTFHCHCGVVNPSVPRQNLV